jgi:hypothetical protein
VTRQPLEGREHGAFRRAGAAAAGHEVLASAEPAAVTAAAAAADADAHRVIHAGVLAGLTAAEAAGLALDVREEVLRVALHLLVVFVVGRLVVVRLLRLGEEDRRLVRRLGDLVVLGNALALEHVARTLDLRHDGRGLRGHDDRHLALVDGDELLDRDERGPEDEHRVDAHRDQPPGSVGQPALLPLDDDLFLLLLLAFHLIHFVFRPFGAHTRSLSKDSKT